MRKTDFDSKLLIYRSRQVFLLLAVIFMTIFFTLLILQNEKATYPWYALVGPITGSGLSFLLIPLTEEWLYLPWQGKARRVEQQQNR